jgi:N utilization substance protein B
MQANMKTPPRHLSRMKAFQFLYGQAFSEAKTDVQLEESYCAFPAQDISEIENATCEGFAWELVAGVWSNSKKLDLVIEEFAKNWRIDRVGRVELGLLRIAIYEMLYREDVPCKVAINEALELNKQFGEEKSRAFLNGILDAVSKAVESGSLKT